GRTNRSEEGRVRAAVDVDRSTGQELGLLRAHERRDLPEVLGAAEPVTTAVVPAQCADALGVVRTGLHGVHGDSVGGDLTGEGLQETGGAGAGGVREDERRDRL